MTIRRKILGTICYLTICLIFIFFAVTSLVVQKQFDQLERKFVADSLERVQASLSDQVQTLDTLAHDWASWDATYNFVNDRNEDFITSNIVEETFSTSANIDLLLIFNTDEVLIHGVLFNKQKNQMEPPGSTLLSSLTLHGQLFNHTSLDVGKNGFVQLGDRAFVISSRPILRSTSEGPVRGILMMGRILNTKRIAQLQQVTRTCSNLFPVRQANIPPDAMNATDALLLSHDPYLITVSSEKIINGYTLLNDVSGDPVLLLVINIGRDIHRQGHRTLIFILLSIIAIGSVFGLVVFFLIDNLVLRRLAALTDDIVQIEEKATRGLRVRENSSEDELGKLSKSINQMMDAIEYLEEYKIKTERLEALATFAAGATHELATPLSTIAIASGEILHDLEENCSTEEDLHDDVLLIREQVNRCKDILYQMAADAGEHMGEKVESISIGKVIDDSLALFDETTRQQIEVDNQVVGREISMPVRCLRRVLRGILKNSIDASDAGKPISLSCRENDTHLLFEISDKGEGMDEYTLQHAVDPFFTTKSPGNGMGLGLYLAQALASRLGGDLQISSSPAIGTTVTLSFAKERIYV